MTGRRVFLTGGNGDIGAAIAACFRAAGDEVLAPSSAVLDLAHPDTIDAFFRASAPFDIDVLVHCAGVNLPRPFEGVSASDLRRTVEINAFAFVDLVQRLAPSLRSRHGCVVAISSIYGRFSRSGRLAYTMAKHALVGAVQNLAVELGPDGVRVNAVSPGFIETRLTRKNNDAATIASLEGRVPVRRLGRAEEIAETVMFLASPSASYVNGHDLVADGGYSCGGFQP